MHTGKPLGSLLRILGEQSTISLTVVGVVFVVLKVISVAKFNPSTTLALLQAGGVGELLVGASLSTLGTLVGALGPAVVAGVLMSDRPPSLRWAIGGAAVFFSLAVAPLFLLVGSALFTCIVVPLSRRYGADKTQSDESSGPTKAHTGVGTGRMAIKVLAKSLVVTLLIGGLLSYLCWLFLYPVPWLPAERLSFTTGKEIVGYVANQGEGWTTIITPDRLIVRTRTESIAAREICKDETARTALADAEITRFVDQIADEPFLSLILGGQSSYPSCPE